MNPTINSAMTLCTPNELAARSERGSSASNLLEADLLIRNGLDHTDGNGVEECYKIIAVINS